MSQVKYYETQCQNQEKNKFHTLFMQTLRKDKLAKRTKSKQKKRKQCIHDCD